MTITAQAKAYVKPKWLSSCWESGFNARTQHPTPMREVMTDHPRTLSFSPTGPPTGRTTVARPAQTHATLRPTDESLIWPSSARIQRAYLGDARDLYPCDDHPARKALDFAPFLADSTRDERDFVHRQAAALAAAGIDQFIDLGCGLPHEPYLHTAVAQAHPDARILYVDDNPVVLAHATALMTSCPPAATGHLLANLARPETILTAPEITQVIDLGRPVALVLGAVLPYLAESDQELVAEVLGLYLKAVAAGSALVLTHLTGDFAPHRMRRVAELFTRTGLPTRLRSRSQITALLDGWRIPHPGATTSTVSLTAQPSHPSASYAVVAHKDS